MNFAEWSTIIFLPLAVMSDFSQLSSDSSFHTAKSTTESSSNGIVFLNQAIAKKCSYCPPLTRTDAINPVLVDCDVSYAMTFDRKCTFHATKNGRVMEFGINQPNPNIPQETCKIRRQ